MLQGFMVKVVRRYRGALCRIVTLGGERIYIVQKHVDGDVLGEGSSANGAWKSAYESMQAA